MQSKVHTIWYGAFVVACILVVTVNTVGMAEEEPAEETGVSGYMRVDVDALGPQIWFGASHPVGGLSIESDIIVMGAFGEFDVGPSFSISEDLILLPEAGVIFDFQSMEVPTFVPQLYIYLTLGHLYLESWLNGYIGLKDESDPDYFYNRTFLLHTLNDTLSIGPQVELSLNLEDTDVVDTLANLAVGGRVNVGYGENNTLSLFVGYETKEEVRGDSDGITGRFTFFRTW